MNVGLSSPRIERYSLLYPTSQTLQKELCNYYSVVIKLCTSIVLFVRKPSIKQIASALRKPFDDEFGTFQKELTRLGIAVKQEISLLSKQQQNLDSVEGSRERRENSLYRVTGAVFRKEIANDLEQARKWRVDRAKSRFLNSCSRYNFEHTLSQARKKGASTWIFKHEGYQKWKSRSSPSTLLCSGIVGAGKTVICANVIEDLVLTKAPGCSVGYFFCRSDEATSLSAREVIGSLARQMFEDVTDDSWKTNHMKPGIGDITLDTEQILSSLLLLLPPERHYVIVLDGLDECDYKEVEVLVKSIQSLLKSSKHVFKVFWTGRSDFASRVSEQIRPDYQVHVSPLENGPEISRFIELALEDALESNRLKLGDPNIVIQIQDALEVGAQEMCVVTLDHYFLACVRLICSRFLWVAFQIESICAENTDYDIIESLKNLPKGLPATFTRILRRLQHSPFADPSLGQKIFEILVAAQRPLTLNELGEAISIVPGRTVWDTRKSINNIYRSLESCGSLIFVDEELATVHFAHSSVRTYLLAEPTDLDVQDYHVDPSQADMNLGKLTVTYLSLDIFGNQLARADAPSQLLAAEVPSFVVRSALPKSDVVNKMALAILRGRKKPSNDPSLNLERSINLVHEKNTQRQEIFSLLPYCQEYWLRHSNALYEWENDRVYYLWDQLVEGEVNTVELPWAPENVSDLGKQFEAWIVKNRHTTLLRKAICRLWHRHDIWQFAESPHDMRRLENFLRLLPDGNARHGLKLSRVSPLNDILCEAVRYGYENIVGFALHEGANINAQSAKDDNPLCVAVLHGNEAMARLLIREGADVNHQGGKFGSALQAAATFDKVHMIELLIASGTDTNARGGKYGTALIAAVMNGNNDIVHRLLEAGADPNANGGIHGTALMAGIASADFDIIDSLIIKGADVNNPGLTGETPLRMAARLAYPVFVKELLYRGANIDFFGASQKDYVKEFKTSKSIAQLLYAEAIRVGQAFNKSDE